MELKNLIGEIDDLKKWLFDKAHDMPEDENIKAVDICAYLRVLKQLIQICPKDLLDRVQV